HVNLVGRQGQAFDQAMGANIIVEQSNADTTFRRRAVASHVQNRGAQRAFDFLPVLRVISAISDRARITPKGADLAVIGSKRNILQKWQANLTSKISKTYRPGRSYFRPRVDDLTAEIVEA